jgi:plastocyanin
MAPKMALAALALVALALSGCTAGSDSDGGDSETSTSGGVGVGGTVSGPGGGVGGNATVSGSASMSSTGSNSTTTGPEANDTAAVSLEGGKFSPDTVTVTVGGTVTWTHNDGSAQHTVTSEAAGFDSHPNCNPTLPALGDCMSDGETFEFTFTTVGEFSYHDKVDTGMTGTVRVVEA